MTKALKEHNFSPLEYVCSVVVRFCLCLFLILLVFAVILSAAKDPDRLNDAHISDPFLPTNSATFLQSLLMQHRKAPTARPIPAWGEAPLTLRRRKSKASESPTDRATNARRLIMNLAACAPETAS